MPESESDRDFDRIGEQLYHYSVWYGLRYGLSFDKEANALLRETAQTAQKNILERSKEPGVEYDWPAIEQGIDRAELALSELIHVIGWRTWGVDFPIYPFRRFSRFTRHLTVTSEMFLTAKRIVCPVWPIC